MPDCTHDTVIRNEVVNGHGEVWACEGCQSLFLPIDAVAHAEQETQQRNEDVLDVVTGIFAATLWDLHQRAKETGQLPDNAPDPELEAAICEERGHAIDPGSGICTRCKFSPFLGGGVS